MACHGTVWKGLARQGMAKIKPLIPLIEEYYLRNPGGGNCHTVLDDGNIDAIVIRITLEYCEDVGDKEGEEICRKLLELRFSQRVNLFRYLDMYGVGLGVGGIL